jgi:uncharacterized protein
VPPTVYQPPGVYFERLDAAAPGIAAVRTDVAGFVGLAERGPIDRAVPIQSWRQFQAHFGGFTGTAFLAYTVRAFFENGGRRCWVVRVASLDADRGARPAAAGMLRRSGSAGWQIEASTAGMWGNRLTVQVREVRRAETQCRADVSNNVASAVLSSSGFARHSLVRLSQPGSLTAFRVLSHVDPNARRLYWVHPDAALRLPTDQPLTGFQHHEPVFLESIDYTLVVRDAGRVIAVFDRLSAVPTHARYAACVLSPLYTDAAREQEAAQLPRPLVITDADPQPLDELVVPAQELALQGGTDGLEALRAFDFIGEEFSPHDSDLVRQHKRRGVRALDAEEIAVVAVPDIHIQPVRVPEVQPLEPCVPDPCLPTSFVTPAPTRRRETPEQPPVFGEADVFRVQDELLRCCEKYGDRFAILDVPATLAADDPLAIAGVLAWRRRFESSYAALYYPWVRIPDPLRRPDSLTRDIPPSGHIAGSFAATDLSIGVHKAPANARLIWIQDITVPVNDARHGVLNPEGINVVRSFAGRGIRVFGARTLSSDTDWQFVNVRRLIMMIKKAVRLALEWAAFESNDFYTRAKIRLVLTSFLASLWQNGALAGDAPEQAFFVRCDETNNPPEQRDAGRLLADVGVAPAKPFEFVVVRVGRTENDFELRETSAAEGAS